MLSVNAILLCSFVTQANALNQTARHEIAHEVLSKSDDDLQKLCKEGESKRMTMTMTLEYVESKKKVQKVVEAKNYTTDRDVQKHVVDDLDDKDLQKLINDFMMRAYDNGLPAPRRTQLHPGLCGNLACPAHRPLPLLKTLTSRKITATLFDQTSHKMIDPAWVLIGLMSGSLVMFALHCLARKAIRLSVSTTIEEAVLAAGLGRTTLALSRMAVA